MRERPERRPLESAFFDRDTVSVARDLLGKTLMSSVDGAETGGRIVETEAYLGSGDPGSHAATRGITPRNATMYGPPGTVYVYLAYGVHHMLNLVCEQDGIAGAVLIRAFEPLCGVDVMRARRSGHPVGEVSNGPGKVTAALGVDLGDNGTRLGSARLAVYDAPAPGDEEIAVSGRIGLSSGSELPLRFYISGSRSVSRARPGMISPTRCVRKDAAMGARDSEGRRYGKRGRS